MQLEISGKHFLEIWRAFYNINNVCIFHGPWMRQIPVPRVTQQPGKEKLLFLKIAATVASLSLEIYLLYHVSSS